jgi:geranylgeranyl reductase family protein
MDLLLLEQSYDVIIVGAGPAGATLAYELAKRGIRVLLLEKETLPRYKCCAGGVTSKTVRLLDFDISEVVEDVIYEFSFAFDLGSPYVRQHSQPLIYTVMRDPFDYLLVKKAQECGAELFDNQKVTQIQVNADWVDVSTLSNTFRSRFLVGADGAYSVVARELNMRKNMQYLVAIESEISVPEGELTKWRAQVWADLGCVPKGYAWVFPKRGHLSIGVGCLTPGARRLNQYHEKFLNSLGIGNYAITRASSHLIPTCTKESLVWRDRALLLGDAAGLADPLTGEGIYNAILSAQLAAPVIEDSLASNKTKLDDYQRAVDEKIMPELRTARVLSRFFVRFPHLAFEMLKRRDGAWKAGCGLMSGELKYTDIKGRAGGFKGIFSRLFST